MTTSRHGVNEQLNGNFAAWIKLNRIRESCVSLRITPNLKLSPFLVTLAQCSAQMLRSQPEQPSDSARQLQHWPLANKPLPRTTSAITTVTRLAAARRKQRHAVKNYDLGLTLAHDLNHMRQEEGTLPT
jgi:hypothetical protein